MDWRLFGSDLRAYRRLSVYARRYQTGWASIVGVTLLASAFSVLQPWPTKVLVDHVLGQQPTTGIVSRLVDFLPGAGTHEGLLVWVALATLVFFALNSAFDVVLSLSWVRVGYGMVYDLSNDLFARVQRRSLLFHSRHPVGDAMSRITVDSWALHTVVNTLFFAPAHSLVTIVGMIVLMLSLDVNLTLIALATAPLMTVASLMLGKPIRTAGKTHREVESRLHSHVQQMLSGIPIVQAFAQEERSEREFESFAGASIRAQQQGALVSSVSGLASGMITTLGGALILWMGANHVISGTLTVGGLLVFVAYLGSLQAQLTTFANIFPILQGVGASIDRVLEVLDAEPEVQDRNGTRPLPAVRGHVRFADVTFGYEHERPILRGITLEARPGETVALVGVSGAGKSTLVSLIPRFHDPWAGSVTIDGHDLRDVGLNSVRAQVGLVLQEPYLFPISIAANIAYGRPAATKEEIERASRAANAHEFIVKLPDGYDSVIGERGATLSGGQRQRLSIARALLKNAPVLILDEPTSALDAETELLLLEALERLMKGRTTFIIAHRLSTIRNASRIAVLQEGRIVEQGTHRELLTLGGAYGRLNALQLAATELRTNSDSTDAGVLAAPASNLAEMRVRA